MSDRKVMKFPHREWNLCRLSTVYLVNVSALCKLIGPIFINFTLDHLLLYSAFSIEKCEARLQRINHVSMRLHTPTT